jgi:hypothetical protein
MMPSQESGNEPEALRSGASLAHVKGDEDRYLLLRGFRPVTLDGYFSQMDAVGAHSLSTRNGAGLERSTLAELYRSQGMTLRALETYGELLSSDPTNAAYQQAYDELRKELRQTVLAAPMTGTPEDATPSGTVPVLAGQADPSDKVASSPQSAEQPRHSDRIEKLRALLSQIDAEKD